MTATLHKILVHGADIIRTSILRVGMLGEEASEAKNKFYKNDRINHTRKCDRISTMSDLFYRSMDCSDPVISSLRLKNCKEREQHFPKEALCMLNPNEDLYISDSDFSDSDSEDQNSLELSEEEY